MFFQAVNIYEFNVPLLMDLDVISCHNETHAIQDVYVDTTDPLETYVYNLYFCLKLVLQKYSTDRHLFETCTA